MKAKLKIQLFSALLAAGLGISPVLTTTTYAVSEYKIVGLGDSIMEGLGVNPGEEFLSLGRETLQSMFGAGVKVSSTNRAVNGTNSDMMLYNPANHPEDLPKEYLKTNGQVNVTGYDDLGVPIITSRTTGQALDNKYFGQLYLKDTATDIKNAQLALINIGGNDGMLIITDKLVDSINVTYDGKEMLARQAIGLMIQKYVTDQVNSTDPATRQKGLEGLAALAATQNEYAYDDVWASTVISRMDIDYLGIFSDKMTDILGVKFGEDKEMMQELQQSLNKFRDQNWEQIIKRIYELNPNVNVAALTTFNPYGSLKKIMSLIGSDFGEVAGMVGETVNPKVLSYAIPGQYYGVDVSPVFDSILGLFLTSALSSDPHLNADGHKAVNVLLQNYYKNLNAENTVRPIGTKDNLVLQDKTKTTEVTTPVTDNTAVPGQSSGGMTPPANTGTGGQTGTTPPANTGTGDQTGTTVTKSSENRIKMIRLNGVDLPNFNPDNYSYEVKIPTDIRKVTVDADLMSLTSKFSTFYGPRDYYLFFSKAEAILKVESETHQTATYKIILARDNTTRTSTTTVGLPSEDLTLKKLSIGGQSVPLVAGEYNYSINIKTLFNSVMVWATPNSYHVDTNVTGNRNLVVGANTITVTTIGRSGNMLTYTITVNRTK